MYRLSPYLFDPCSFVFAWSLPFIMNSWIFTPLIFILSFLLCSLTLFILFLNASFICWLFLKLSLRHQHQFYTQSQMKISRMQLIIDFISEPDTLRLIWSYYVEDWKIRYKKKRWLWKSKIRVKMSRWSLESFRIEVENTLRPLPYMSKLAYAIISGYMG